MIIRNLNIKDYKKYITLINSNISNENFIDFLNNVLGKLHIIYILEIDDNIIGTGTLFIEKKITYGGCNMGHIENILIDNNYRKNGYGEMIVRKLLEYAKINKCYRIDLNCTTELESFYNKNNFNQKHICMNIIFKENFN